MDIEQEVSAFLAICRTAALATVDGEGRPHGANVQYVSDGRWRLSWVSSASAAHSVHLGERAACAATVYAHDDRPEMIHGVQLRGEAELVTGDERRRVLDLYRGKFSFVADEPYATAIEKQGVYRLTPTWLRWIDNRRGFGFKVEQTLS
ncbi:MAG: pyridoxamine 5'-phosphate oxidase family protein [Planctomycetota bacterium]